MRGSGFPAQDTPVGPVVMRKGDNRMLFSSEVTGVQVEAQEEREWCSGQPHSDPWPLGPFAMAAW